ncbi:hypothetical protein DL96DRAFT_1709931 [Flagelloscypha sp. PMI_526]|nr:hypothetical protein DL96DRAFT_1709931 [Flagelloscypha sp. PMI_526]
MKLFILLGVTMLVAVAAAPAPPNLRDSSVGRSFRTADTSRRDYEDIVHRDELVSCYASVSFSSTSFSLTRLSLALRKFKLGGILKKIQGST